MGPAFQTYILSRKEKNQLPSLIIFRTKVGYFLLIIKKSISISDFELPARESFMMIPNWHLVFCIFKSHPFSCIVPALSPTSPTSPNNPEYQSQDKIPALSQLSSPLKSVISSGLALPPLHHNLGVEFTASFMELLYKSNSERFPPAVSNPSPRYFIQGHINSFPPTLHSFGQ